MSAAPPAGDFDPAATVGAFLCAGQRRLRAAGLPEPRAEARLLLGHALGAPPGDLIGAARRPVPAAAAAAFADLLRRRLDHAPVAHLLGERGFWTLTLAVSPATLIPRPDSEALIEAALDAFPDRARVARVLDLGTGAGGLLLAALAEFPGAWGLGVDLVPAAARLAAANAARNGLGGRAAFAAGDWGTAVAGTFDLVLCNPPYVERAAIAGLAPEVARHEPASALDGGPDGLDAYRAVLAGLPALLAPGGRAVLELGQGQRAAVAALAAGAGLDALAARADLGGVERALVLGRGPAGAAHEKTIGTPGDGV